MARATMESVEIQGRKAGSSRERRGSSADKIFNVVFMDA